jgi:hypothetical protein
MSVLLEGSTEIKDEEATWSGMWQFAKDKKAGVSFKQIEQESDSHDSLVTSKNCAIHCH